jgi:hypothetical protein
MILRRLLTKIAISIKKVVGIPSDIKPGDSLDLNGAGDRFSGESNVEATSHEIDNQNYPTDVDTERSKGLPNNE